MGTMQCVHFSYKSTHISKTTAKQPRRKLRAQWNGATNKRNDDFRMGYKMF